MLSSIKKFLTCFANHRICKLMQQRFEQIAKTRFGSLLGNLVKKLKKTPLALSIFFFGLLVSTIIVKTKPVTQAQPKTEKIWPVAVVAAESIDMQPKITIYGEVKASRTALLKSKLRGKIVSLNPAFKDGNFVESGIELSLIHI